ncbi:hypothetical protein D3C84_488020 [compost metagenome]
MEVLRGVEFYSVVPIARRASDTRLFAEAGDAQLQWVAETVDAQLARLLKGLARLRQQIGCGVRFAAHGKQRPAQRISGPRAAQRALIRRQCEHFLEVIGSQFMVTGAERHGARQIEPVLGRQTCALRLDLMSIAQRAQLFDQRLLRHRQTSLFGVVALHGIVRRVHAIDDFADVLQTRNRLPETTDLEPEVAFRQLRQRLAPVVEQAHREIRPAGHCRTQWKTEAQAKQMAGPVTGEHSNLLDQCLCSAPNRWRAAHRPGSDRRAGG